METRAIMMEKFVCVEVDEAAILDVLDDDLFAGDLTFEQLATYNNAEPITALDVVVGCALQRARQLTIPEGIKLSPKMLQ